MSARALSPKVSAEEAPVERPPASVSSGEPLAQPAPLIDAGAPGSLPVWAVKELHELRTMLAALLQMMETIPVGDDPAPGEEHGTDTEPSDTWPPDRG